MTAISLLDGISAIARDYDAMLCDAWGVIHDGVTLFPGAEEALIQFRKECGPVIIITNAPRPSSVIPAQLDQLGLSRDAWDGVITSGDATRAEIAARLPSPAYRIGPSMDDPLFEGLDIEFAPLRAAQFIVCTGLEDPTREHPDDYKDVLGTASSKGLVMVCANPDIRVNWGGRLQWCAGALAQIYEEMGGSVVYGGKPYPPIYRLALAEVEKATGKTPDPTTVLAIGDGVATDIAGANKQGIDALFIAGRGGVYEDRADESVIAAKLAETGVHAVAAAEALKW